MADFLKHPLVVLAAGALLTGLLLPSITRRWQDRQRELEIKTGLIAELTLALTRIVFGIQIVRRRRDREQESGPRPSAEAIAARQSEFDDAYSDWEIACAVIGTKLRAYFSRTSMVTEWDDLARVVSELYELEGKPVVDQLAGMEKLLGELKDPEAEPRWENVKAGVLRVEGQLVQRILDTPIHGFGRTFLLS